MPGPRSATSISADTSYFGPRLVQTPYGDIFYGSSPLAGTKLFGQVAIDAEPDAGRSRRGRLRRQRLRPSQSAVAAPPPQLPYWMQMPPGWGELPAAPGGAGGGGSGGSGSGGGDSGR